MGGMAKLRIGSANVVTMRERDGEVFGFGGKKRSRNWTSCQRRRKLLKSGPTKNIDSSVRRGVVFGEGAVPHPQLEKFLTFSNTKSQFSQHKIVKIRL